MSYHTKQNSQISSTTWIYCPGHAGVSDNEMIDCLEGRAAANDILSKDKEDIVKVIMSKQ